MADLTAIFRRPFPEQLAALRLRLTKLQGTRAWDDFAGADHDRMFMVAGAMQADLLADLAGAVDKAIAEGTTLDTFRRDFREIVERRGWHGWTGEGSKRGEAWRTRVIYRTNVATTYAAGRRAQLVKGQFPYWVYRHGGSADPRLHHLAWDGMVLPADHPFWATHSPPNGWGCSCRIFGARSMAGARRLGGDPDKALPEGWNGIDPRTGVQTGIDKGWNHAPGATVADTVRDIADKIRALPPELSATMVSTWRDRETEALAQQFSDFVEEVVDVPRRGRSMVVGALEPSWVSILKARGLKIETAALTIRDEDVNHLLRSNKKGRVSRDWLKQLPLLLREADDVFLDLLRPAHPALQFILRGEDGAKIVVRLDYKIGKDLGHVVRTARRLDDEQMISALAQKVERIGGRGRN